MFGQESSVKPNYYNVFVVKDIGDFVKPQIVETYKTCVDDVVYVLISEARRDAEKRGNGHYLASDDKKIAEKYNIKLILTK